MTTVAHPISLMAFVLCAVACASLSAQSSYDSLFPRGTKAPNVHHTGDVWLYHPEADPEYHPFAMAVATMAAGAKLDWHLHPAGQRLIVLEGVGYYQERGDSVRLMLRGQTIDCPPGVEHWHAASADESVIYLAVSARSSTEWKEPVSEEAYRAVDLDPGDAIRDDVLALSRDKWQWMADKDADRLAELFHPQAKFVHMGGTWGKDREVEIIRSGGIHYKQADVHETSVDLIDDTAIVLSNITLLAVVGGNEVTNPFEVTEVYKYLDGEWKLLNLSFTRLMNGQ